MNLNTGIKACDELRDFHLQGNVVPQIWYRTIVKNSGKSKKPNMLAIAILSDVVYWYRPVELRNESGEITGYSKKFKEDLLMRSYDELMNMYGYTHNAIKEALVLLESLGVVHREFRTKVISGVRCANIMYLSLDVENLKRLTYPSQIENRDEDFDEETKESNDFKNPNEKMLNGDMKKCHTLEENKADGECQKSETNTKNTAFTSTQISSSSMMSDEELETEVDKLIWAGNEIPIAFDGDEELVKRAIKILTDYDDRIQDSNDLRKQAYLLFVDCLTGMICTTRKKEYRGSVVENGRKILKKVNECLAEDGDLYDFVNYTLDDFCDAVQKNKIADAVNYMTSVIWTSLNGYRVKKAVDMSK